MMLPGSILMNRRLVSLGIAILAFAALSAVSVVIFRSMEQKSVLESRNAAEQTMSSLFAALRDHDDFGSAIENSDSLRGALVGVSAVAADGRVLHAWGDPPAQAPPGSDGRQYIENPKRNSIILVLRAPRDAPPREPPPQTREGARERRPGDSFLRDTLREAETIQLEIRQAAFWQARRARGVLFPVVEIALAALVLFVRYLVLRNAEYRRRIEEQKNLVLLGTAAGTLAHEIKNPLLAIRLQTSILERVITSEGRGELDIINAEVERLSALTSRIGDVLRDPAGNPADVNLVDVAREVGTRLCGRDLLAGPSPGGLTARIDPERLRSILENLVRNALESGGREQDVALEIAAADGRVRLDVLDRGTGVKPGDTERIFDPFFTTKSRGTGIGLTISRRFAAAAGGTVTLESRVDGGCRARLVLPRAGGSGA